jgi:signal transduction histidine kinase
VLTGGCLAIGLFAIWVLVSGVVEQSAERSFNARLVSLVDAVAAATALNNGRPYLTRPVSEPRFSRPLSGCYYQIEGPTEILTTSPSLATEQLPAARTRHPGLLTYDLPGPLHQHLRLAERDFIPTGGGGPVHVLVAESLDKLQQDTVDAEVQLGLGLLLVWLGLTAAEVMVVHLGLRGLRRLPGLVSLLRMGERLPDDVAVPSEAGPLLREITALTMQNRALIARMRVRAAHLADSIRTRVAIMRNALDLGETSMLRHELAEAEQLAQHHLTRTGPPTPAGDPEVGASVASVADDLAYGLRVAFGDQRLEIDVAAQSGVRVRCGRDDLSDILDDLMENACKWARSRVRVSTRRSRGEVVVTVSDDGPGMSAGRLRDVRDRLERRDGASPVTGLGLAFASDLATVHGGRLEVVSPGPDGGVAVHVTLPAAEGDASAPVGVVVV